MSENQLVEVKGDNIRFLQFLPDQASDDMMTLEEMQEQMEGLKITYDRVKIPSGGMTQFEIPNPDDPEHPEYAPEIQGIIVCHHPSNAYWMDNEKGAPACSAYDGKTGVGNPGGKCSACCLNKFGSGEGGRGKACKNTHRVYILRPGYMLPLVLTLPATSINGFSTFMSGSFGSRRISPLTAITSIKLKRAVNPKGDPYSVATFSVAERCTDGETCKQLKEMGRAFAEQIRASMSNYQNDDQVDAVEAEGENDMLPFN